MSEVRNAPVHQLDGWSHSKRLRLATGDPLTWSAWNVSCTRSWAFINAHSFMEKVQDICWTKVSEVEVSILCESRFFSTESWCATQVPVHRSQDLAETLAISISIETEVTK